MRANSRMFPTASGRVSAAQFAPAVVVAGALMALLLAGAYMSIRAGRRDAAAAGPHPPPGPTPDYSNVNDILNGGATCCAQTISRRHEHLETENIRTLQTTDSAITNDSNFNLDHSESINSFETRTGGCSLFRRLVATAVRADPIVLKVYSPIAQKPSPKFYY